MRQINPLLALVIALNLGMSAPQAKAQSDAEQFAIKEAHGSRIAKPIAWSSDVPLNRTYEQLTPKQRKAVHEMYEVIGPGDEPPFPANGLRSIVDPMVKAQAKLLVTGKLLLYVDVNTEGRATAVSVMASPDQVMTKLAASVLIGTRFKPAVCGGSPCNMQFPYYAEFRTER